MSNKSGAVTVRALLISVSGMDSSGKSTQIGLLRERLISERFSVIVLWSRGGYTPLMENAKKLLRLAVGGRLPSPGVSSERDAILAKPRVSNWWLRFAILDLMVLYGLWVRVLLMSGRTVICDRYLWDTYVDFSLNYPNSAFQYTHLWRRLEKFARAPDVALFMSVSPEVAEHRSTARGEPFAESLERRRQRSEAYDEIGLRGVWDQIFDSETRSPEEIARAVWSVVQNALR